MTYQIDKCFFDWYQHTVSDAPQKVTDWMEKSYPEGDIRRSKPKNGSAYAAQIAVGEMVLAQWIWGGGIPEGMVNIWASGFDAQRFAELSRERYPLVHKITRADAAVNYDGVGAWEFFSNWGLQLADKYRLKVEYAGDHHRGISGRTIYIGSSQSVMQLVIYEKGRQIPELEMPNLVRVEVRVMPKGHDQGTKVSMLKPKELYKCSRWGIEAGEFLFSDTGWDRVVIGTRWTKTDTERARAAFLRQYSGVLGEWMSELGSWGDLGEEIGRRMAAATIERQNALSRESFRIAQEQAKERGIYDIGGGLRTGLEVVA